MKSNGNYKVFSIKAKLAFLGRLYLKKFTGFTLFPPEINRSKLAPSSPDVNTCLSSHSDPGGLGNPGRHQFLPGRKYHAFESRRMETTSSKYSFA
jgi:hypothetical protein